MWTGPAPKQPYHGNPKYKHSQRKVANEYYTTEGMIAGGKFYPKNGGKPESVGGEGDVHGGGPFGNFINCVRSRKREELNAEAIHGHYSSALCHLGNISYRMGTEATWGELPDPFGDNAVVEETFANIEGNLGEFDIPVKGLKYRLGRVLDFDPKSERFTGKHADEANKYVSRDYRKPFTIPQNVVASAG